MYVCGSFAQTCWLIHMWFGKTRLPVLLYPAKGRENVQMIRGREGMKRSATPMFLSLSLWWGRVLLIQIISWSLLAFIFVFSFCILYLYLYFYFVHCLFRSVVGVYLHFQHLELELLFPCSSCKVHLPPSLSITSQKELNKTKLVKTSSSTFYPFETLQIDEVALISLSGSADKEKVLFFWTRMMRRKKE